MRSWADVTDVFVPTSADALMLERLDEIAATATTIRTEMPDRLASIRAALAGWPRAASYTEGGGTSHAWCWTHEREVARCFDAGLVCAGEPLRGASDPTGETAIAPDRAATDRRQIDRHISAALRELGHAQGLMRRYEPHAPTTSDRLGTPNERGCGSCARLPGPTDGTTRWEPVAHPQTTAKGNLEAPMALCSWCYRWTLDTGRLPTREELKSHHEGAYVKRPA